MFASEAWTRLTSPSHLQGMKKNQHTPGPTSPLQKAFPTNKPVLNVHFFTSMLTSDVTSGHLWYWRFMGLGTTFCFVFFLLCVHLLTNNAKSKQQILMLQHWHVDNRDTLICTWLSKIHICQCSIHLASTSIWLKV